MSRQFLRRVRWLAGAIALTSCRPAMPTGVPDDLTPRVVVTAAQQILAPNQKLQLTVQVFDSTGRVLSNEPVTWASSSPAVASVSNTGLLTALAPGATTISATARGMRGYVDMQVEAVNVCTCAVVVDSTNMSLVSVDSARGIYTFKLLGAMPRIDTTSILVGIQNHGFLRHVHSVSVTGDQVTVVTSQAGLADVVTTGGFASSLGVADPASGGVAGVAQWGPLVRESLASGVRMMDNGIFSLNGLNVSGNVKGITLSFAISDGYVQFNPVLDLGLQLGFRLTRTPICCVAEFHAIFRGDFGIYVNQYTLSLSGSRGLGDLSKTLAGYRKDFIFWIGPIPVVGAVILSLKASLGGELSAAAEISGDFHAGEHVEVGARYDWDNDWQGVAGSSSSFGASPPSLTLRGGASVKFGITPDLYIQFYGIAGPFVNVEGYAQAAAGLSSSADWFASLGLGLDLNTGFRIGVLGKIPRDTKEGKNDPTCTEEDPCDFKITVPLVNPFKLAEVFSTGPIAVRNVTTGADRPKAGFGLSLRPGFEVDDAFFGIKHTASFADVTLPLDGSVLLSKVRSGPDYPHILSLTNSGVPGNCAVGSDNPQTIAVKSDLRLVLSKPDTALFQVDCIPFGNLAVRVQTTGPDQDPDGYALALTRVDTVGAPVKWLQAPAPGSVATATIPGVGTNGTTSFDSLIPKNPANGATGLHAMQLAGVRRNCAPARPFVHQVAVGSSATASTTFSVACIALGHLKIVTGITDPDSGPAVVQFLPSVTPGGVSPALEDSISQQPAGIPAGQTVVVDGIVPLYNATGATGAYVVGVGGLPNRCKATTPVTRTVTVLSGDTAATTFKASCVERLHVRTITTGPGSDPDGYVATIQVGGVTNRSFAISGNDIVAVAGIVPGTVTVSLSDVNSACIAPPARTATVSATDSTMVTFTVACPAPASPPGLAAKASSSSQIDVSWLAAAADSIVASYKVYRNGTFYRQLTALSFSDTGLPAYTQYFYQVSTVNKAGLEGARSLPQYARTFDSTPPSVPQNLAGTPGATQIDLRWDPSSDPESGVQYYRVYRGGVLIDSAYSASYTNRLLAANTAYTYRVTAVNGDGLTSAPSASITVNTRDDTPPPAPTSLVARTGTGLAVLLTWNAVTDAGSGISRYVVYRDGALLGYASSETYTDYSLVGGQTYTYQVSAINGVSLEGAKSNSASATTPDVTPPTAPTGLGATPGSPSRIDLRWSASSDPESGIESYRIYRDGALFATSLTTNYSDVGLGAYSTHVYQVAAVNGAGLEGPKSNSASATTLDATPPSAPTGLTPTASSSTQVSLSWTAAVDPESGVSSYDVYRDGVLIGTSPTTTFISTGLSANTTYSYEVAAVNGAGLTGPRSTAATVTTPITPTTGSIVVTTATSGTSPHPFTVVIGALRQSVSGNASVTFAGLSPGSYSVTLLTDPGACTVQGSNPRTVIVTAGGVIQLTFNVVCVP